MSALVALGIGSALAGLAGSAMSYSAQAKANEKNEDLQREQWERDDHAYTRMVQDMNNAGLNPLSSVSSPVNSNLSAQVQPQDALGQGVSSAANSIVQAVQTQKQMDLQSKTIALQAIRNGISPSQLDKFTDDEYLRVVRRLLKAQMRSAEKDANSHANRNSGVVGKIVGDVRDVLPDDVNEAVDDILDTVGSYTKGISDDIKEIKNGPNQKAVNGLKKAVKSSGVGNLRKNK